MRKEKDQPSTQQPTVTSATKAEPDVAQETRDRKDSIVSPNLSSRIFSQVSYRLWS